ANSAFGGNDRRNIPVELHRLLTVERYNFDGLNRLGFLSLFLRKETAGKREEDAKDKQRTHAQPPGWRTGCVSRVFGHATRPLTRLGSPSDHFTTFTANLTSCVVGTLPFTMATARTVKSPRAPGATLGAAFKSILASSLPGAIVTGSALS